MTYLKESGALNASTQADGSGLTLTRPFYLIKQNKKQEYETQTNKNNSNTLNALFVRARVFGCTCTEGEGLYVKNVYIKSFTKTT